MQVIDPKMDEFSERSDQRPFAMVTQIVQTRRAAAFCGCLCLTITLAGFAGEIWPPGTQHSAFVRNRLFASETEIGSGISIQHGVSGYLWIGLSRICKGILQNTGVGLGQAVET